MRTVNLSTYAVDTEPGLALPILRTCAKKLMGTDPSESYGLGTLGTMAKAGFHIAFRLYQESLKASPDWAYFNLRADARPWAETARAEFLRFMMLMGVYYAIRHYWAHDQGEDAMVLFYLD